MKKKYIIFDFDWTIIDTVQLMYSIIIKEVKKIDKSLNNNYILLKLNRYNWKWIKDVLKIIIPNISSENILKIEKNIKEKSIKHINKNIFKKWILNLIKNISKNYQLFLTSWNYQNYINSILELWEIKQYFKIILWSDKITKSEKHLEYFKEKIWDKNFYKNSVYIWDWKIDEVNAKSKWIDFIYFENKYWNWLVKDYIFKINNINELIDFFEKGFPKKILEKEILSNKYIKILQKDFINPNFSKSSFLIYWHNKEQTIWTFVIPITKDNEIIYIKEYRAWPETEVISFPVWALEDNISEIENCKKELEEETWYISNNIEYLWECIIENNFEWKAKFYIALGCTKKYKQNLENWENIKVYKTAIGDFKNMIINWKINFAKTVYWFTLAENKWYFKV